MELILTGEIAIQDLQQKPFSDWYTPEYESYVPDSKIIKSIRTILDSISIVLFIGIWCGDSKREVPHFYRILHQLDFDLKKVTLISTDRNKRTLEQLENGLNITHVPLFIIYRKDKEIGRIVEKPITTLEENLLKILSKK